MKATIINNSDICNLKISSLPTKPTAPKSMGGMGYGAKEMKEAFDRLPLFIIEQFNALIEDIGAMGKDSLSGSVPTGLKKDHTLSDLFSDIKSGEAASYITVLGESLASLLLQMREDIANIKKRIGINTTVEEEKCQE